MIRMLPPEEAKKIAAGEVIDRPAALVREFIDNALDSGAQSVELAIEGGGIDKVEVIDDGSGMNREDLALCVKTHATSKIQSLDDLSRSTTLGFRGEALAAAASVARLEILTSADGREAWLLETNPGAAHNGIPAADNPAAGQAESDSFTITQSRRVKGTSIRAYGLFDAIPARKRFLKREAAEAALCRQIFIEKALAFPGVTFRFVQDRILKLQLLPCPDGRPMKRFGELFLSDSERNFLHLTETSAKGFSAVIIFGGPELHRQDRRQQYIFANKRRIQDYGLMQALEYGLDGYFPNNSHPVGAVFVEVDPALADFNIHPAKREVRFADSAAIHHGITSALRSYVRETTPPVNPKQGGHETSREFNFPYSHSLAMEALLERRSDFASLPKKAASFVYESTEKYAAEPEPAYYTGNDGNANNIGAAVQLRFIGRAFGLFIIVEKGNKIYLIDQHAAHERLLYNHFLTAVVTTQELLVPIPFTTSGADEENFLLARREELKRLGIVLENGGGGDWRITALPAGWKAGDDETVEELLSLHTAGKDMAGRWAASLACRMAIKDGGWLDNGAALTLAKAALALEEENGQLPRCPHGRPLWTEIRREDLLKAVRRIE